MQVQALLHGVPAAVRCIRLLRRNGLPEGRDWRGRAMEENMQARTIDELMHLTRDELCDLDTDLAVALAMMKPAQRRDFRSSPAWIISGVWPQ